MNRADGYRIDSGDLIYEAIPHIMDKRYDASNYMDLEIDMEPLQKYINSWRGKGQRISYMAVMIAAYIRTAAKYPYLNRFVMNKKIYARNHFCVSFVTLKSGDERDVKVCNRLINELYEMY